MRNHLCCSAPVLLILMGLWDLLAAQCRWREKCVCLQCPAGQEPSTACGEVEGAEVVVRCQTCPKGTFSDAQDTEQCRPHTVCRMLNRWVVTPATSCTDAVCGGCLPGFHPAAIQKASTLHGCVRKPLKRLKRNVGKGSLRGPGAGVANATNVRSPEEKSTEYAVFALVPIFCVMGLLGIFICNILKKKGYRCTAEKEPGDEEAPASPQKEGNPGPYIVDDTMNEDTISVLVRLITEKKENAAALEELLLEYERKQMAASKAASIKFPVLPHLGQFRSLPRLCPHQHLHTVNGLASRSGTCCSRCSQKKWPQVLPPPVLTIDPHQTSTLPVKSTLSGEPMVLSVGRFQVAQIPENKAISLGMTPHESSDTDSVNTTHTEPAEEKCLLSLSSSSNSSSSKSRQEMNL
ncbi:tumor necrosis factor receptor superfamily member 19L [Chanos chanos]|uniref:Tumor necrosis factor receptor superfamily member 19L n=1 Tax=Chanos chanos TaxID=29144 RepID=A0A6J2UPU1_CHACN|nr:tumor necrosis factor receptor superfamily member 19L [Chanos chanos]